MSKTPVERFEERRPPDARADLLPTEGYSVEVDGKLKAQYPAPEIAFDAGIEIKRKFPFVQVRIYDAKERTRTPVDLPKANDG
ncbi:hypothetical protein [Chelatococcus reniformis]|uniref:Uncharacterized protein n=1 Tax=Chelatococcus reniformis TaxID=1494448 RepID=A0A916U7V3_9HYPH|nr:hypothetical protein [Chelatococcus reniformis]GGC61257.1 hypothetical protein GCM10010994_19760 [Chelatococcus reniformis]